MSTIPFLIKKRTSNSRLKTFGEVQKFKSFLNEAIKRTITFDVVIKGAMLA